MDPWETDDIYSDSTANEEMASELIECADIQYFPECTLRTEDEGPCQFDSDCCSGNCDLSGATGECAP